jgi:hypothetical protein
MGDLPAALLRSVLHARVDVDLPIGGREVQSVGPGRAAYVTPALLTRMSRCPDFCMTCATAESTAAGIDLVCLLYERHPPGRLDVVGYRSRSDP